MSTNPATSTASAASTSESSTSSRVAGLTSMLLTLTHTLDLLRKVVHRVRCRRLCLATILHVELGHSLGNGSSGQLGSIVLLSSTAGGLLGLGCWGRSVLLCARC